MTPISWYNWEILKVFAHLTEAAGILGITEIKKPGMAGKLNLFAYSKHSLEFSPIIFLIQLGNSEFVCSFSWRSCWDSGEYWYLKSEILCQNMRLKIFNKDRFLSSILNFSGIFWKSTPLTLFKKWGSFLARSKNNFFDNFIKMLAPWTRKNNLTLNFFSQI